MLYKPYSIDELLAVTESCIKRNKANSIDLSSLLAFGDKRRTLEKLAATTQSDMDEVRKAAEAGDMEALNKLGVKWDEGATQEEKLERIITHKYYNANN